MLLSLLGMTDVASLFRVRLTWRHLLLIPLVLFCKFIADVSVIDICELTFAKDITGLFVFWVRWKAPSPERRRTAHMNPDGPQAEQKRHFFSLN